MKNYAVIIDYFTDVKSGFEQVLLNANSLVEAMSEAENYYDKERVYLINLAERIGTEETEMGTESEFSEVLTNRGHGWHNCDEKHSEVPVIWRCSQTDESETWEIVSILDRYESRK